MSITPVTFIAFTCLHVALVSITGLATNMNHITLGTDARDRTGIVIGLAGIAVNVAAHWLAWKRPRLVQHAAKRIVGPIMGLLLERARPRARFGRDDISPYFRVNGKEPTCPAWLRLTDDGFADYRLVVGGLVEHPVELSVADLRALGHTSQITQHHCIQGLSGIAEWGGVPLSAVVELVKPRPEARAVVFHSFNDGAALDPAAPIERYYDSLSLRDAMSAQTLLAYEMNSKPLHRLHGAPLRLRVENQLGFKMVKWIQSIEFVADVSVVRGGKGGFAEDREYFGESATI